jgi:hypothetical protein
MSLIDTLERIKKQSEDKKIADYLKRTVPVSALGIAGGMTPGFEILSGASSPPVYREPEPTPKIPKMGMGQEFIHSLGRVPSQTVSQILDMAAFVSGSKSLHEASEISQQLGRKDFPSDAPQLSSMDELSNASIGDIARYAVAESGQAIASIGSMMIPGAAARVVAAPVVKALVGYSPKMAKLVSAVGGAEKAAEYISAYAGGSLLEAGSISAESFQKTGEMPERLRVVPWAMVAGAFESMEPIVLLSRLRKVVPDVAEEAAKKSGRDLVKYVLGYAKDMGLEGGTEFAQTLLEEAGAEYATGKTAIESLGSLGWDSFARATAAGIAGSAGGGLMRGVADTGNLFLTKKQISEADPVAPPTTGPNTDITIPEPVKPTPGAQAPAAPASAADEVIPPQYQDQLLGAVEKAKQLTAKSDVGENDHPVQAGAKKLIRKINDTLAGIGVTGDMVNQFATEIGGSPIESMQLPQLQQVYQAAVTLAAQGHTVAAPVQAPHPVDPVADAVSPLISAGKNMTATLDDMQNRVLPKYEDIANRVSRLNAPLPPQNIEQAIAIAQQQAQIKQAQPAAPQITQPARQPMGITQPEMEPRKLVPMPKLPTVEQINAMEQEELDAARKAIGGVLYAKPDEYPVEVIEAADALDAAAAKRQESLNIKREEEDEKPIYSKFVPHESGDISAEMTYAIRPEAYQKIYGKPGAIVSIQLKGKGLKSETGFMSVAGVTTSDTSPEGLRGLMDRVIAEQSKPAEAPKVKKSKTSGRPKLDMNALLYSEPETIAPATTPMPAVNPFRAIVDKFDHEEFNKPDFKPDAVYRARMVKARRALKAAIKKAGKLTPSIDVAIEQMKKFNGLRSIADMVDAEMAPAPAPAPESEPELTLEQQLAEAKEQLKQAEYQPIKAGGVPVMDARKEQRKRELREKIQRLEAEIEAVVQPTPALSPEPAPAPAAAPSYGETNTLVSKSRYEELKAKFNSKTKNIASGIDPELMAITAEMAVYHLEAGARKFADFAKAIIADVGESFRPYLKSAYLSAKYFPGAEKYRAEMDSESEIDAAVEPAAAPAPTPAPSVGKVGEINIPALSEALVPTVESWLTKPMSNSNLMKVISDLGIDTNDAKYSHKLTQEAVEGAIVRAIRKLKLNSDQVLQMYQNQPALDERTVTSILNQAYSTPAPLSMMLIDAIGFGQKEGSVYEPTAGNGLLLSGIRENEDGTLHDYRLNELEKNRNDQLKSLFPAARITNQDAMTVTPERKVDLVMTNPPFGSLKSVGQEPFKIMTSGEVETEFVLTKLDHAIAAKALQSMKDNGKAVLILGAELDKTDKTKSEITGQNARFMDYIYNQYNVTGHFELSGDLYKKQGAAWPVIVVTIEGRKSFPKNYVKSPKSVERAATWNEVKTAIAKIESGKYLTGEPRLSVPSGNDARQKENTGRTEVPDSTVGSGRTKVGSGRSSLAGAVSAAIGNKPKAEPIRNSGSNNEQAGDRVPAEPKTTEAPIQSGGKAGAISDAEAARQASVAAGIIDTELQSVHEPESKGQSIGALVPANLKNPMKRAMKNLAQKTEEKSVDEYVAHQLGYDSAEQMGKILSAQQIDALGLTFYNFNNSKATIVADQTGVGKGRIAAASIAWAVKNGYIPVFTTEAAGLFNDIYRDLKGIKESGLVPFIMNADASMSDADGNIVHEFDKKKADKVIKRMESGDFSDFGPDGEYDYIAMTYSQVNTESSRKMNALLKAPRQKIIAILDESHNAAGTDSNQGENIAKLIDGEVAKGVLYLSATWSKTPEQMAIYHRAFGDGMSIDELNLAFLRGGVAMQEMTVASMADKGAYVRREQSFANVTFERKKTTAPREIASEVEKAEKTMDIVRDIIDIGGKANRGAKTVDLQADDVAAAFGNELDDKGNAVTASVDKPESPFSQVHNYVGAFLTSLKADAAANAAIEAIKKGVKPVIVLQNTMGSAIDQLIEVGAARVGEGFGGTFADVLDMMLEKTLIMPIKNNFTGKQSSVKIPLESMPAEFQEEFKALKAKIRRTEFQNMPFSPIDYIANKIKQAGYSMGELTGRDKYLDYGDLKDGKPILKMKEIGNQAEYRKNTINGFNNGDTDAFLFNVAGATGMSIHSSVDFKDQRQREMIILQPFGDINKFMQAIGRTHRVGEIVTEGAVTSRIAGKPATYGYPSYKYLQSALGMEIRSGIALEKKMKSLNAQTSSNEKGHQSVADVDVMNKYGLEIMKDWLRARPAIMDMLDLDKDSTVEQITGRIAVLKQEEQEQFWQEVVKEYQAKIQALDAAGENDLVPASYNDSNAKTLSKKLIYGEEGSLTSPPIWLEHLEMTMTGKPTSLEGARQRVEGGVRISEDQIAKRDEYLKTYLDVKREENADAIANGKEPSFNISTIQAHADGVKKDIAKLVPGTIVSSHKGVGIITDVYLDDFVEGSSSFPWNPSAVNLKLATPGVSGNLVFSLAAYRKDGYSDLGMLEDGSQEWIEGYNQEFKKNSTKKVKRYMLTGDLYRATMMSQGAVAVKFQRDDGTFDFGWMQSAKSDNAALGRIKEPPKKLTEDEIINHTPSRVRSSDLDGVEIRPAIIEKKDRYGNPVYTEVKAEDGTPAFWLEIRKTNKKYAKALYSNRELLAMIKTGPQSDALTEVSINGRKYLQSEPLSDKIKAKVMQKVNEIIKSRGGSLVDTNTEEIDAGGDSGVPRMASPRSGAISADLAAIPAIAAKWAARKLTSALESAYNALVRGSGSFIDWLNTLAGEARRVAAEIWKDARKLAAAMKIPSLNRKGAIMSLPQAIKIVKEQLAQKPLPQPGESVVTEKAAVEVAVESFKTGVAEEKIEAKGRSDRRAARLKESAAARYEKLKDKLSKLKKLNQAQRLIRTQGKKFLIDLANRLPVAERASLIRGIANADTVLAQADVINRIDKLIDKVVRRNSAKRFQAALRGAKQLRPEFQSIADELKKNIVTRGHVVEALDAMNRYLLDNPTAIVSEERLETLRRLAADRSGKLNPATMDMFSELLETITFLSDQENERMFSNNAMTAAQSAAAIVSHVDKQPDISSTDESWAKWFFNVGSLQFEAIADMLGDAGRELFYGDMRRGERKAKSIWFAGRDAIHETMREIGLDPDDLKTAEWLDQDVGGMTRNERMNLVANLLDKSTREEIIRGGYKLKGAKKDEAAVQISERDADNMIASLDKREAAMVKTMRRFLNTTLKSAVNESWVQLAGYEKALADDYWPRTRDIKQTGLNEGYRKWMNTALEQLGIFKQREKSKAAVMVGGIMETYQNHMKKASTFAGLAVPIRNTEIVLAKISDKVESRYGKKYLNRVKEQLSAMADLGNPSGGEMNAGAAAVLNRVSISLLGANVRAAAKQFGGLFTASTEISPALLRDSMGDAFSEEVRQEMMDNSPILRDRYDSSGARLVSPTFDSGEDIVKTSRADYYRRLLMLPLEKCDQAVSQIIWSAAKKELKATGLKGQELLTATAERAEQIVSRTQNVTSILDMSGVALEGRKSVWWKVMTLFQSQGNSIYNILRRAVKNYRTGKIDSAQLMGVVSLALAGNAVWSMVIGNLVTLRGWGDDDEEDKEKKTAKMISEITFDLLQENAGIFYGGSLFGAPFLRQAKRIVNKELIGLKDTRVQAGSARVENAMESAANSGLQAAEHFLTASLTAGQKIKTGPNRGKFKSEVELKKGIWKAARLTASMTGVPMILLNEGSNLLYDK